MAAMMRTMTPSKPVTFADILRAIEGLDRNVQQLQRDTAAFVERIRPFQPPEGLGSRPAIPRRVDHHVDYEQLQGPARLRAMLQNVRTGVDSIGYDYTAVRDLLSQIANDTYARGDIQQALKSIAKGED